MSLAKLMSQSSHVLASRAFLLFFASLLMISISIAYVASEPRPQERFLSISTLGSNMILKDYYPTGSSTIDVGDNVNWYLNVYNRMGEVEYLSVRIKLLNATQATPESDTSYQSTEGYILELKQIVQNNSTWVVPLTWSIKDVDKKQDHIAIKNLEINGMVVDDLNIKSTGGDFRMIIELWRYDANTGDFAFDWDSKTDKRNTWNQVWFNIKQNR